MQRRRDLFYERREVLERQLAEIQRVLDVIRFKCWYYDTAVEAGTESVPKGMALEEMPEEIRRHKDGFSE